MFATHFRSSLPGGTPWVALARFLMKSFHSRGLDTAAPSVWKLFAEHRETLQRLKEIGFDHDRPARCVHEPRRRLHEGELRGTNESARAAAEHKVNADDIVDRSLHRADLAALSHKERIQKRRRSMRPMVSAAERGPRHPMTQGKIERYHRDVPVEQPTKFELAINLKTSGATAVTYCR